MSGDFEQMLEYIFDSEYFCTEDALSAVIRRADQEEFSMEELDFVAAAQMADFGKFENLLKRR